MKLSFSFFKTVMFRAISPSFVAVYSTYTHTNLKLSPINCNNFKTTTAQPSGDRRHDGYITHIKKHTKITYTYRVKTTSYLKQLMTAKEMINYGSVGNNSGKHVKSLSNITLRCITQVTVILRRRSGPVAPLVYFQT